MNNVFITIITRPLMYVPQIHIKYRGNKDTNSNYFIFFLLELQLKNMKMAFFCVNVTKRFRVSLIPNHEMCTLHTYITTFPRSVGNSRPIFLAITYFRKLTMLWKSQILVSNKFKTRLVSIEVAKSSLKWRKSK